MRFLLLWITLALASSSAQASCPKTKKEWQARGPKLLVQKASRQSGPVEMTDFSGKLGKSAKGQAFPFRERKTDFVLVEAQDKETSLFLSGVMKCDPVKKEPVLLSLTWVLGDKSGLVKLAAE